MLLVFEVFERNSGKYGVISIGNFLVKRIENVGDKDIIKNINK